jgi:hypothetical protein
MTDIKFPCKIYHLFSGRDAKGRPLPIREGETNFKELTVSSQKELDGFLKLGWTTEEPK